MTKSINYSYKGVLSLQLKFSFTKLVVHVTKKVWNYDNNDKYNNN